VIRDWRLVPPPITDYQSPVTIHESLGLQSKNPRPNLERRATWKRETNPSGRASVRNDYADHPKGAGRKNHSCER